MSSDELSITGYLDRFSHRPGETFTAQVSVRDGTLFRARLRRVVSADPNPAGPGMRLHDMSALLGRTVAGARHPVRLGSYAVVDSAPACPDGARSLTALVWPGAPDREQSVITQQDGDTALIAVGSITFCGSLWRGGKR